jgi:hypothetical protein
MKLSRFLLMVLGLMLPGLAQADPFYNSDPSFYGNAATTTSTNTTDSTNATATETAAATPATSAPAATTPTAVTPAAAPSTDTPTLFGDLLKKYNVNPTGSVTLDAFSRYVWRGQYLDRRAVFEPGVSITANGLTVGYWSNWGVTSNDPINSGESDYYLSYAYTIGNLTLSAGHTWYGYPGTGTSSKEFYFSASYNCFLTPTIAVYHDYEDGRKFGKGDSDYFDLTLSQTWDLYKPYGITYTVGTTLGFIDHQWVNGTGWHFTPTLAVNVPITKSMTISPTVGYNFTGGALHDKNIGNYGDDVFGGVHTVVNF